MIAFVREVSADIDGCQSTHAQRKDFDHTRVCEQHSGFVAALEKLGVKVEFLPALPEQPDAVFVEDAAVLLGEIAIIARPGAKSRLPEIDSVGQVLGRHRPLQSIVAPATLDGGDVLRIGRSLYVGESRRTNAEGIEQLREIVRPLGYEVTSVPVRDCLHLKSACTFIPPHHLVANTARVDTGSFRNLSVIAVDESEPTAANTLTIGGTTLVSASCPKTTKRLREAGIATRKIDVSEFEKADGGITCLALLLEPRTARTQPTDSGVTAIRANGVPALADASPHAVVSRGTVYVAPVRPFDPASARKRRVPAKEQMEHALRNLSVVLGNAGSSPDRVLQLTLHVADPKLVDEIEEVYARTFGSHRPARSVIGNPALPPGILVQIEAVAAVANGSP